MPRLIDFGGNYGVVSFPDDATDEQIVEQYRTVTAAASPSADAPSPSVGDYIKQGVGQFIRGAGSTIGAIPEGIGIARDAVRNLVPETLRPAYDVVDPLAIADLPSRITGGTVPTISTMLRGAGAGIRKGTEQIAPESVPELEESFWASKVPQGLGSLIGFAVPGGIISRLTRMPQWLSIGALGSAVGGAEFYQDAISSGADQDTAELASLIGNAVGTSEAIPISKMMRRLDGISGGTFSKAVLEAGKDTLEEAIQEGAQQLAQNITAQQLYDQDRELFRDVVGNAGVGGVTGFLASALTQAIGIPIGRSRLRREGEQRRREVIAQEVEQGRLLPQERTQNATPIRTVAEAPSPEEGLVQEEGGGVRLRDVAQDRLEAQAGTPVEQVFESRVSPSVSYIGNYSDGVTNASETIGDRPAMHDNYGFHGGERWRYAGGKVFWTTDTPTPEAKFSVEDWLSKRGVSGVQHYNYRGTPLTQTLESRAPIRVPIQIQSADGSVREGEFTGYYDMRDYGKGILASVGWTLPDGNKTHGMLKPDETIIGPVPTFEEWQQAQRTTERRQPVTQQGLTPDLVLSHLASRGITSGPGSQITVVEAPNEDWDAKSVFRGTDLQRIELNASKLTDPQSVDAAIEHELAHVVSIDGAMNNVLDALSPEEKTQIVGDMIRLGYDPRNVEEIDARGTEILSNAWKERNWFTRIIARILELANRIGLPMTRLGAERIASRAIHAALKTVNQNRVVVGPNAQGEVTFESKISPTPATPQFFQSREQVEAAVQNPGITESQQQQARDLAAVQSSMAPDSIVGWLMQTPRDAAERFAQNKLSYIEDRRHLSDLQRALVTMPETTPDEIKAKEVAAAQVLGHYGLDRATEREINDELEHDQTLMVDAVAKLGKLNINQIKANFLTALFNRLTSDYRVYLNDLIAAAPSSGNLQSVYQRNLAAAERRLNEQAVSPIAAQRALSAIASNLPANLLQEGTTNQQIIDWLNQQGVLIDVVGEGVREWLLINDGTGSPALLGYTRLREDMATLRDVLQNQQAVATDIRAFEDWFRPSGATGKVSAKNFAENYFKFRTARDRAIKVATTIEKNIDKLDTRIRGNITARGRLQSMMIEDQYVSAVREAARKAHVVVRALYESQSQKTGLIERDKTVGRWRMTGPLTGTEYVVDLYPSASSEQENRNGLTSFATEARLYAQQHEQDNPLLSDEYNNLADYIEKYLLHPSLDPAQGFIQEPWMQIPGTSIRIPTDPFDIWGALTGPLFRTIRDTLERIGGRVVRQAVLDAHDLDRVMRKVEAINANPKYGYAAQTQAVLSAIKSHGWSTEQFARWDEDIAERTLAAGQNNLGPTYEVGDYIVASGVRLTSADVAALKIMKQWEDAILASAPKHVMDRLGDLGIVRKAISSGRFTMARVAAPWTRKFMIDWADASTDEAKLTLLKKEENFRRVILGYMGELNPEFAKMNPASPNKSPLFEIYRKIALSEKSGVQSFGTLDEVLDFIAAEMVARDIEPDFTVARTKAQESMLSEIKGFITAFDNNVINFKTEEVYGGVPPAVVQIATANNSFTIPRGQLQAPSTFYTYSTASDGRRLQHVGSLRSLLNLKLLQAGSEARAALEKKKFEMDLEIQNMMRSGLSQRKARIKLLKQTAAARKASQIRYDYKELIEALSSLEKVFNSLQRFEASTADHYEHAGVAALNNVFGTIKAFLLSSTQAITTNYWSGTLLGPAIFHWQAGQYTKAMVDVFPAPHLWKTVMARVADIVSNNPIMASLLRKHAPLWNSIAENVIKASVDWRRIQQIAEQTGMVNPYNLGNVNRNKRALKRSAGRLDLDDPHPLMEFSNMVMSAPGVRHLSEGTKFLAPRFFDNLVNYSLIASFEKDMEFLAKNGWAAFQAREAAAGDNNWRDLSDPANILLPGDLGLKSFKGLDTYRNLFAPLGSLDRVLLDYYERTKNMSKDQREQEPLIEDPNDYAALALEYAAITNVATETRRSFALKGKGSDGLWRNVIGTFMGWVTNMTKQFAKAMQTHSKDPKRISIWNNMIGIGTIIVLLSSVGAWNWEFGDELTKLLYNQSSARIQVGNIQDVQTAALYFIQSLVNTVPVFGPAVGNLAGLAFTGRGQPFDPASLMPMVGFALGTWNTVKRIVQTRDVVLPMADWSRQWMPFSKILINRAPIIQGLVEQQNAVRALNASAPPGTEIKWGQRIGGEIRYSPANDEIQKLISSAYDVVSRGGNMSVVQARLQEAINAYVATGRTEEESQKLVISALSSKEPIRILTGKEMTPEEEQRWVKRMTPDQKGDYDKAVAAWRVLSGITGRDFEMVTTQTGGGGIRATGGGGGAVSPITGLRRSRSGGLLRLARPPAMSLSIVPGIPRASISSTIPKLSRRRGARRNRRLLRSPRSSRTRSRVPRISRRRRSGLGRRLRYSLARA